MNELALITRPATDSAELASRLSARGFEPVVAPLFCVEARSVGAPAGCQAVLATSGNALAALTPGHIPLFAVGDATAARARAAGFATVHSAGADAVALAELAACRLAPKAGALLLASGAGQGGALAADLRGRGFRVVRRVAYRARPVKIFPPEAAAAIGSGQLSVAVFLSAETAATFVRLVPADAVRGLARVVALAIGRSTEVALSPLPWLRIERAGTPTLDGILALL